MKRILACSAFVVLAALLMAIVGGGVWVRRRIQAGLPVLDGEVRAPGLSGPIEILRDARGVPHIRARSIADALFGQGYVTAQDRLWQMDLSRRNAEGELSEIFGHQTLRFDIESHTLGLRRIATRALDDFSSEERFLLAAYARGINAFIEEHRDRPPIEFLLLRYEPRRWQDVDSVAVALNLSTALSQTWPADLMRERIIAKLGKELSQDILPDHSTLDEPVAEVNAVKLQRPRPNHGRLDDADTSSAMTADSLIPIAIGYPSGAGSNNWVVSGSHTKSGKPLLANDPHLLHSLPSTWYMVHLKAPGLDVAGVSLPGLPFVILGHNEHIAWGMTNTSPDVQDLYSESFDAHDPTKYLHNGQWVDAEVRDEIIKVRRGSDYHLKVVVTRHGPVISHDGNRNLALQWTLLMPHVVRFPFQRINQANNWREFTAALRDFHIPMQNCVYADDQGNIGFFAAGLVPIRKMGDGSVPVPGSTDDYDWTGFIPFDELPHSYNPPDGIIATANGRIFPDSYPYFITARWEAPFRTARVYQLLRDGTAFTPNDMLRIQTDIFTIEDEWLGKRVLAAAADHPDSGSDVRFALGVVKNWDGEACVDSTATLILETTRRALLARILKPKLGDELPHYFWPMSGIFIQNAVDQSLARWLPPGDADFDETVMKSLRDGLQEIPSLVHSHNHADWTWGRTIPVTFSHPLSGGLPFLGRFLNVGPFPQAGTGTTVKQTTPRLGPSMRMVVDLSDLDQSLQNITLGESGQVFSPYYRDQFSAWHNGQSFPIPFSDNAVEKSSVHKLVLQPGQ